MAPGIHKKMGLLDIAAMERGIDPARIIMDIDRIDPIHDVRISR